MPDEACPECGAYWGHPNKALDFPNRPKVDNHWRCYNPECVCGFYRDGRMTERKPTQAEQARIDRDAIEFVKRLSFGPPTVVGRPACRDADDECFGIVENGMCERHLPDDQPLNPVRRER